jgi:hypothetical protein
MAEPEFTTDQLMDGVASAIKARNFAAAKGILMILALQDPHEAERLCEVLQAAAGVLRA